MAVIYFRNKTWAVGCSVPGGGELNNFPQQFYRQYASHNHVIQWMRLNLKLLKLEYQSCIVF